MNLRGKVNNFLGAFFLTPASRGKMQMSHLYSTFPYFSFGLENSPGLLHKFGDFLIDTRGGEMRAEPINFRIGKYNGDSLMGQYTVPRNCCGFSS